MIIERLKSLRTANKISQKDFAKALKVSQQTVASWEVGRTEPSNVALKDIADYFNVTIDYLLGRETATEPLSKVQTNLLKDFESLNNEGQNALMFMLGSLKISHGKARATARIIQSNIGNGNILTVGNNNIYGSQT